MSRAPSYRYDRRAVMRRGAAIVLSMFAIAVLAPPLFALAWGAGAPDIMAWLLVLSAVLLLASGIGVLAAHGHLLRPIRLALFEGETRAARYRARFRFAFAFSLFVHA